MQLPHPEELLVVAANRRGWVAGLLAAMLIMIGLPLAPRAVAQSSLDVPAARPAAPAPIRRSDVAFAYIRFEQALAENELDASTRAELNRAFDRTTGQFFNGDLASTARFLNGLTWRVRTDSTPTNEDRAMMSLVGRFVPPVVALNDADSGSDPEQTEAPSTSLHLRPLYRPSYDERERVDPHPRFVLRIVRDTDGLELFRRTFDKGAPDGASMPDEIIPITLEGARPGDYRLEITWGEHAPWPCGRLHLLPRNADVARERLAARLDEIAARNRELSDAIAIARTQLRLLSSEPSTVASAEYLAGQAALLAEIERDIERLAADENPYVRRAGSIWRVMQHPRGDWPYRLEAPHVDEDDSPLPLMIALHGAGADENMFSYAYGAGELASLARERRFLLVTPLTYPLVTAPEMINTLIRDLEQLYPIDPDRVYLLGHSLGAGAMAAVLNESPRQFAAACGIAGFGRLTLPDDATSPPILILAGELDPIIRAERLRELAEEASERGASITFRSRPDLGHTLIVGEVLSEAVDWLLERSRQPRADHE